MSLKNLLKNEDAVSITVGFILTLSLTVLVFSGIVLSFYTLIQQSEKAAMMDSFDTMGSGLAVKLTTTDTLVNITNNSGGWVNNLEYDFSIPATISIEQYSIDMTNSTKQIILESDNGAEAWIPFNTSSNIAQKKIYSNAQDYKFIYSNNNITIGGQ